MVYEKTITDVDLRYRPEGNCRDFRKSESLTNNSNFNPVGNSNELGVILIQ